MENTDLFDRYINGELSDQEISVFKDRLKTDKEFALDFSLYAATVTGICREAEQDDKDFEMAMKNISKDELKEIIGADNRDTETFKEHMGNNERQLSSNNSDPGKFKRWFIWQSMGIAALLGIVVIYVVIVNTGNKPMNTEALAISQAALDKVDNTIYMLSGYAPDGGIRSAGENLFELSDDELKAKVPELESEYNSQSSDVDIAAAGDQLAIIYIRLHEREKAKALLTELISRFQDNEDEEISESVERWKVYLSLLE